MPKASSPASAWRLCQAPQRLWCAPPPLPQGRKPGAQTPRTRAVMGKERGTRTGTARDFPSRAASVTSYQAKLLLGELVWLRARSTFAPPCPSSRLSGAAAGVPSTAQGTAVWACTTGTNALQEQGCRTNQSHHL